MRTTGGKLSAAGGTLVVAASLLPWTTIPLGGGYAYRGTMLSLSVFYKWDAMELADSFLSSAGLLVAFLAIASIVGVYLRLPWLRWAAGGIVTFALGLLIVRFLSESDPDPGLLLGFAGGVLGLVGTFFDSRRGSAST